MPCEDHPRRAPAVRYARRVSETFSRDLELLLRSRHAIVFLETDEKDRADALLRHVADRLRVPFLSWTRTKGLRPPEQMAADPKTVKPHDALGDVEARFRPGVYHFQGLGADLADAVVATRLRDAARQFRSHTGSIVISGDPPAELPAVLRPYATFLPLPPPDPVELRGLFERLLHDVGRTTMVDIHMTSEDVERLVRNLAGLTLMEAEKVLTKAMIEDGRLDPTDLGHVVEAKRAIVERDGLLEYYPADAVMADVAGLGNLKEWLARRRAVLEQPHRAEQLGLPFPKGVLLLGVQGAGKSLGAKAIASDWKLPLLKMDPASLYNKYIGETEKNLRRAMRASEAMAPVVLWIDEIEKAFADGGDMDGGVSQRALGIFLTWLQERRGDVFVAATANDISKLPPELVRKGRFDEIFFVDLPDLPTREAILGIHLRRRGHSVDGLDLPSLALATDGFSGAELEQVVVSSLYAVLADGATLTTELLLAEVASTRPLSVTMGEQLHRLRAWAAERTVSAH